MNGPQHFAEGERLLRAAEGAADWEPLAACAQAHFTAALAAATALAGVTLQLPASSDLATEWNEAIGVPGVTR